QWRCRYRRCSFALAASADGFHRGIAILHGFAGRRFLPARSTTTGAAPTAFTLTRLALGLVRPGVLLAVARGGVALARIARGIAGGVLLPTATAGFVASVR